MTVHNAVNNDILTLYVNDVISRGDFTSLRQEGHIAEIAEWHMQFYLPTEGQFSKFTLFNGVF